MSRGIVVAVGIVLLTTAARAEDAPWPAEIDWPTLRRLVLERSPELAWHRSGIAIAQSTRLWAEASPNPSVEAAIAVHAAGADTFDGSQPSFGVAQPIRLVGKARARRGAAEAAVQLAEAEVRVLELQALIEARRAHAALLVASARAHTHEAFVTEVRELQTVVTARREAGAASDYEVAKLARELALVEVTADAHRLAMDEAADALAIMLGVVGWRPATREPLAEIGVAPPLERAVPRTHAELARVRALTDASAQDAVVAELERWPDLVVAAGVTATTDAFGLAPWVGLSVDLLAFDTGRDVIAHAQARNLAARREADWVAARLAARLDTALHRLLSRREALTRWDAGVGVGLAALATQAREAYRAGRTDLLDVLDTLRSNAEALLLRVELVGQIIEAEIDVLSALGMSEP